MTTTLVDPVGKVDIIEAETSTEENHQFYEVDIQEENVTSQELINHNKYTIDQNDDDPQVLLDINIKVINNLLRNSFDYKENLVVTNVGSNIPYTRENIITGGYQIELTESPIFSLLDVPSYVIIKWDEDYEKIQKINEIYKNNNHVQSHISSNTIALSINSSMINEECQTLMFSKNTVSSQVNYFNIIDTYNEIDIKQQNVYFNQQVQISTNFSKYDPVQKGLELLKNTEAFFNMSVTMERILAQNTLNAISDKQIQLNKNKDQKENLLSENKFLTYCFTLENNKTNLPVKCMHWHEIKTNLLAIAYSKLVYHDYEDKPTTVAVWNMKNPHTPERFFEFNESAIECLKFSTENLNHLAVGFYSGELLIIDISYKSLNIIFQKSKQLLLETHSIIDLYWTVQIIKNFRHECLMTCNCNGHIRRYLLLHGTLIETIIIQLPQVHTCLTQDKDHKMSSTINTNSNCVTKFIEFNQNTYFIATGNGIIYTCLYANIIKYLTKRIAHYGIIRSLEKSPHDQDVYLTTGCDCCIKIWIGSILMEPVITLYAKKQFEKAIWSQTNPTIIVSIADNCIYIWDISLILTNALVSIHKIQHPSNKLSNLAFTLDGKHICVSDISGTVLVYAWSNILSTENFQENNNLIYCIALSAYYLINEEHLINILCKERSEFSNIFLTFKNR